MGGLDGGAEARVDARAKAEQKEQEKQAPVEGVVEREAVKAESQEARDEVKAEVEETVATTDAKKAEDEAAEIEGGTEDPDSDVVVPTSTPAPVAEKDFMTKLSDAWGEVVDAIGRGDWEAVITTVIGLFSTGGTDTAVVEAEVKKDEDVRDKLVEGYKKVLKDLKLPEDVRVDSLEVGYMLAGKYDTPAKLRVFLTGKKAPEGWAGGSLSEFIDALNKPAEEKKPAEGAEKLAEKKPVTYDPPEGIDTDNSRGICKVTLKTGESIGFDRCFIYVGGKKFKIEVKQSLLVIDTWLPVSIQKLVPDATGGCKLTLSAKIGSKEPTLDVEKITTLVRSLNQKAANSDQIANAIEGNELLLTKVA